MSAASTWVKIYRNHDLSIKFDNFVLKITSKFEFFEIRKITVIFMNQKHLFISKFSEKLLPKSQFCAVWCFLLTVLLNPMAVGAVDITQQLHRPLKHSAVRESREEADMLVRQGEQQEDDGKSNKAIESWLQALDIYHLIGDLKAQGLVYDLIGKGYVHLGRLKEAEDPMRRRLAIARDTQDFQGQIFALNNIGTLLLQKGEFTPAAQTFTEAVTIAREVKNIEGQGLSLSNLGLATLRLGDYNKAIKLLETALIFRRRTPDAIAEANTLNNLGDAYLAAGNYQDTIGTYGSALRMAKVTRDRVASPMENRTNELRAIDGLVTAHRSVGRYERAFDLLEQRLTLATESENLGEKLKSFESYALLYEQLGNYPTARNFYERAIILARTLEDSKREVLLLDRLTQMLKQSKHR
ncbi:tetratricopeptide repeat protein [Plectonema radiosum NIES-515]|uniref:Tetratricopeptide repeat protein n=1 Tax=Plectonema radiosum NIES-515 TaxID=2986073 RepID=A0ABT3B4R7_9CYAN|nr:tetratricopeptide repeat protein [Plectonema radiosum]MCV3216371.1 tetratricopeptide repeat protein [Plectonema radiosum NIES-515]